jgi:hypothetical protein
MRWAWKKRSAYRVLAGKPEGKRPQGRPRYRGEDIKINLREIGLEGECGRDGFIRLRMGIKVVDFSVSGNEPLVSVIWWEFLGWLRNLWLLKKRSAPQSLFSLVMNQIVNYDFYF